MCLGRGKGDGASDGEAGRAGGDRREEWVVMVDKSNGSCEASY